MARKLKIMENEKLPIDDLKNDEITEKYSQCKRSGLQSEISLILLQWLIGTVIK